MEKPAVLVGGDHAAVEIGEKTAHAHPRAQQEFAEGRFRLGVVHAVLAGVLHHIALPGAVHQVGEGAGPEPGGADGPGLQPVELVEPLPKLLMADLLHQRGHIVLHLPDHVCQRDALALQQFVDADAQQLAQRQHIARLRQPLPALPFGDGLFTKPQRLRQRALGVAPLPPHGGYKASRFFLIHTDPLHCMSIAHCTSAGEPTNRRVFRFFREGLDRKKME